MTATIEINVLEKDVAKALERLHGSMEPTIILDQGQATAILLSVESYQKSEAERSLLKRLAQGEREIAEGQGFSLEEVLAEADSLLRG
jgi:hypothetical protein